MTEAQVIALVRQRAKAETQEGLARKLRVAPQYVQAVVSGRAKPGPKVLKGLGLRRVVTYVKA